MVRVYCVLLGYVFGMIQTSYFLGKAKGIDIRTKGSGNAGTTNTLRVLGPKAGLFVLACDILKTMIACFITKQVFVPQYPEMSYLLVMYTAAGAILGHNFPFYLKFKGGKGTWLPQQTVFRIDPGHGELAAGGRISQGPRES